MKILVVGSGKGSWEMRGLQLGAILGARVASEPCPADLAWADVVVLVKRAIVHGAVVRASGTPMVWDALDFWRQPADNSLTEAAAVALLERQRAPATPVLTLGATEAMARACGGVCLPHHGRIDLTPTDARLEVRRVGYDGNALYLDAWGHALQQACARRGWSFVVNPTDLSAMDLLVSFRGGIWDGWICRQWKSGVKIANAVLAGRPILVQDGAAARELAYAGTIVPSVDALGDALDAWSGRAPRQQAVDQCRALAPGYTVEAMAERYRTILASVVSGMRVSA